MDPWWTQQTAGLIGGALGGGIGLLGAGLGVIAGYGAPKGKGKPAVLAILGAMLGLGALALVAGVAGVFLGQPYHVYYPLLLIGGIGSLVGGINAPIILRRYQQAEARKLDAEELRRS